MRQYTWLDNLIEYLELRWDDLMKLLIFGGYRSILGVVTIILGVYFVYHGMFVPAGLVLLGHALLVTK